MRVSLRAVAGWAFLILGLSSAIATAAQDVREIVRRSIDREVGGADVPQDYTYSFREVRSDIGEQGKAPESKTYEVLILYGARVLRLTARDDMPLPSAEETKERAKFEEEVRKLSLRSAVDRAQAEESEKQKIAKEREFLLAVPDAYDLLIVGEEKIAGRDSWIIEATPRQNANTGVRGPKANLLRLYAKLWIGKEDFQWIRLEAEVRETLTYGFFLARIYPGSRIVFENRLVNGEIWAPSRIEGRFVARLFGVKKFAVEDVTTYFDYRKFRVKTRILEFNPSASQAESRSDANEHPNP